MDQSNFEYEVKKIASQIWPEAFGGGSEVIDGLERDGVYVTDETVHLIECTISRAKEKAEKDVGKLSSLARKMQKKFPDKGVKGWFITKDEPTADQRAVVNSTGYLVTSCSFEKFQSKLIDVHSYISCRYNYAFGSIRDPFTGDIKLQDDYIDLELRNVKDRYQLWSIGKISETILNGGKVIVQGHYGVGKSMTLKEIYKYLNKLYLTKSTVKFPIYINLRDHHGQRNPVEAIERHARNIGYKSADHLVRAWRSGYAILILDGYDEIASLGWTGVSSTLKEIRYKSMELIREFIRQNPVGNGILLAGRSNYFDSLKEIEYALNLPRDSEILSIGDFTRDQITAYLTKKNITASIPEWVPSRPLLLGYLVAKGILSELISTEGISSPAEGWDVLLDEISKRESAIEAGLPPDSVRQLIEGVATYARKFQNGLGPIFQDDLERVFSEKCGYSPDDRALVLLQRLPGLAPQDQQDGARYFIDEYFVSIAKAGEVVRFIQNSYDYKITADPRLWQETLDEIGIQLVCMKVESFLAGQIEDAIINAKKIEADVLATDCLMALNFLGRPWRREQVVFRNILIPAFEVKSENDWNRVRFEQVIFRELVLEDIPDKTTSPFFKDCYVGTIVGCTNGDALDCSIFDNLIVDNFEAKDTTTSALLALDLPVPVKVGLTILKKLYLQAGGGRQENAFYRGLSTNEKSYIPEILEYFKQYGVAIPSKKSNTNNVWQPSKIHYGRIRNLLINRNYKVEFLENLTNLF